MTDRRGAPDQQQGRPGEEPNPFAPPPESRPTPDGERDDAPGAGPDDGDGNRRGGGRSRWGSQWSRRQPRRQGGDFGSPQQDGEGGRGWGGQRWDPSDPKQRHARYAVLAGMWGIFTVLLGWEWLALFLAAFAMYWGVNALRRPKPEEQATGAGQAAEPAGGRGSGARPQVATAVAGVVLASAAFAMITASYTVQMVYKDYFDCVEDALTVPSRQACEDQLPEWLEPIYGQDD